uniref:Autophagy-related protein n=1 Tax=Steinernema glaseri TaxID=37863 RepID=A0A1I7ZN83_9BILA
MLKSVLNGGPSDTRPFKKRFDFEERKALSDKHKKSHPDHVVVICERGSGSTLHPIAKNRFSVDSSSKFGSFVATVRDMLALQEDESIFMYVADVVIPPYMTTMGELYGKYADDDGFLYVRYQEENVFG